MRYELQLQLEAPQLGSGMIKLPLQRFDRVEALEEEDGEDGRDCSNMFVCI